MSINDQATDEMTRFNLNRLIKNRIYQSNESNHEQDFEHVTQCHAGAFATFIGHDKYHRILIYIWLI